MKGKKLNNLVEILEELIKGNIISMHEDHIATSFQLATDKKKIIERRAGKVKEICLGDLGWKFIPDRFYYSHKPEKKKIQYHEWLIKIPSDGTWYIEKKLLDINGNKTNGQSEYLHWEKMEKEIYRENVKEI